MTIKKTKNEHRNALLTLVSNARGKKRLITKSILNLER